MEQSTSCSIRCRISISTLPLCFSLSEGDIDSNTYRGININPVCWWILAVICYFSRQPGWADMLQQTIYNWQMTTFRCWPIVYMTTKTENQNSKLKRQLKWQRANSFPWRAWKRRCSKKKEAVSMSESCQIKAQITWPSVSWPSTSVLF